jgi:hypothetical protein
MLLELNLIESTQPYGDNCSLLKYKDDKGRIILFRDTNFPYEYLLVKGTHKDFNNKSFLRKVSDVFVEQGLSQHKFKGGYDEAIQTLLLK